MIFTRGARQREGEYRNIWMFKLPSQTTETGLDLRKQRTEERLKLRVSLRMLESNIDTSERAK